MSIAPLIGSSSTTEHVVPMFLALLRDENADVRLPLLKNLEDINKVLLTITIDYYIRLLELKFFLRV